MFTVLPVILLTTQLFFFFLPDNPNPWFSVRCTQPMFLLNPVVLNFFYDCLYCFTLDIWFRIVQSRTVVYRVLCKYVNDRNKSALWNLARLGPSESEIVP